MRAHITLSPKQLCFAMLFVALGGAVGTLIRDLLLKINLYAIPRGSAEYAPPDWTHQIPWVLLAINTVGVSVSVPLRVFDRNQGEKLRTQIDITRNEKLRDAAEAGVLSDVDSGYATIASNLTLLRPYKAKYLQQSLRVRDTIFFSYQNGGASLLDFLNAQSEYRSVQLNYVNLVGSYLTAAAQLNMAVGREVIP